MAVLLAPAASASAAIAVAASAAARIPGGTVGGTSSPAGTGPVKFVGVGFQKIAVPLPTSAEPPALVRPPAADRGAACAPEPKPVSAPPQPHPTAKASAHPTALPRAADAR